MVALDHVNGLGRWGSVVDAEGALFDGLDADGREEVGQASSVCDEVPVEDAPRPRGSHDLDVTGLGEMSFRASKHSHAGLSRLREVGGSLA